MLSMAACIEEGASDQVTACGLVTSLVDDSDVGCHCGAHHIATKQHGCVQ